MSSHNTINSGTMSNSDDKRYRQKLVKWREEAEARLREEEKQQWAEQKARKEARVAEKRRQEEELRRRAEEEEAQRKAEEEETQRKEEECQRDLAHWLEADRVATVEQQQRKNWTKTFLPSSPPSDKDMNLIDLLPLTKRQRIWYLPQETPEARQRRKELAKEMGVSAVGRGNLCKRCMDFGVTLYKHLGKISDILHLNNENNQLERRAQLPRDVPLDAQSWTWASSLSSRVVAVTTATYTSWTLA